MQTSIIIPCYNHAQYLPEAIESALAQTVPCEVIVVNDGSTDNTSEVAKKYNVKLIEKENGGLASARNAGIKEAKGEWILTLDADDTIPPEFVETCLQVEADIIGTAQKEFGVSDNYFNPLPNPTFNDFWTANRINCCSLYKKEIWEKLGGYDESMRVGYEDWDFWLRATHEGYTVRTTDKTVFNYRKRGESMVSEAIRQHKDIIRYIHNKFY